MTDAYYVYDNFTCTAETTWSPNIKVRGQVIHPDAEEGRQRDGYPGGDLVDMRCPHCGHEWTMELPQ